MYAKTTQERTIDRITSETSTDKLADLIEDAIKRPRTLLTDGEIFTDTFFGMKMLEIYEGTDANQRHLIGDASNILLRRLSGDPSENGTLDEFFQFLMAGAPTEVYETVVEYLDNQTLTYYPKLHLEVIGCFDKYEERKPVSERRNADFWYGHLESLGDNESYGNAVWLQIASVDPERAFRDVPRFFTSPKKIRQFGMILPVLKLKLGDEEFRKYVHHIENWNSPALKKAARKVI